ncbi:uncharacterized protein [Euwallacea similis]|uniref:uncharacterized protein n=1 Tax=Euwallacea similis TaxID=1736056 RepID=UPI00344DEF7E
MAGNKQSKVLRPILIEDYKYEESPESLQNLMQFIEANSPYASRVNILVGLIFLLMVETGFVPSDNTCSCLPFEFNYKNVMALSKNLPQQVLSSNTNYSLRLILPNLQMFEVKLLIVIVSDDLVVNCFVKGIESGCYTILLDSLKYLPSNTNMKKVKFQHLDQLSRLFKEEIAFPAKCSILKQNGIALPCLEDLPSEIILIIMKKLSLMDLGTFGKVNYKFRVLSEELFKKFGKKMQ